MKTIIVLILKFLTGYGPTLFEAALEAVKFASTGTSSSEKRILFLRYLTGKILGLSERSTNLARELALGYAKKKGVKT